jgi:hypothetical protein
MPKLTYLVGDEVYQTQQIEAGAAISAPQAPEREGYDFVAWQSLPSVMPQQDCVTYAEYVADSFMLTEMVDGQVWQTKRVQSGTDLTGFALPEKRGYTFSGWVKKYKKMPKSNLTLHGSFKPNRYRLMFEVEGMVFERSVEYGTPLDTIAEPARDGYTFSGWGKIPATMPDRDLHFSGSFRINSHTLTYLLDGEPYETQTLSVGEPVKPVTVKAKDGHVFSGWRGLPKTMPDEDLVIEGKYYQKKSRITFSVDGEKYAWVTLPIGDPVMPPDDPQKAGFVFRGWKGLPKVAPAKDVTVTAVFETEK